MSEWNVWNKKPAFLVPACNTVSDNPGHFKCKICHFSSFFHVVMLSKLQEHFFFPTSITNSFIFWVEEILSDKFGENWKGFQKVLQSCDPECTVRMNRSPTPVSSLFARSIIWEASWWCVSYNRFKVSSFFTIAFFLSFNKAAIAGDFEYFGLP